MNTAKIPTAYTPVSLRGRGEHKTHRKNICISACWKAPRY